MRSATSPGKTTTETSAVEGSPCAWRLQHARQLFRVGNQLAIVAAFAKQLLRMRFLEVAAADFAGRNGAAIASTGNTVAVAVEQAVDQVQVPGPWNRRTPPAGR